MLLYLQIVESQARLSLSLWPNMIAAEAESLHMQP